MGVVGGPRGYDGPGLGWAPWKCPACGVDQQGPLDQGCTSCGAGSARPKHVGIAPPSDLHLPTADDPPAFKAVKADMERAMATLEVDAAIFSLAETWAEQHPEASLAEAFVAGYKLAAQHTQARTMAAPPVTADIEQLAPAGKVRRTIIAALDLFKDQVLRDAETEVASGEWCSVEEVEQLLAEMRKEESHG